MDEKFIQDNKVNILAIVKFLWSRRKKIIILGLIGAVLGFFNAKFSHKIYESKSTVVPNDSKSSGKLRGLSGLASLAGITMGGNDGGAISPAMYSTVVNSYTFRHQILNQKINVSSCDTAVTIIEYYDNILQPSLAQKIKKYTIGAPFLILKALKGEENGSDVEKQNSISNNKEFTIKYTPEEQKYLGRLNQIVKIEVDEMSGAFTITSEFPDEVGAALIVKHSTKFLQKIIIDVMIKKAQNNHKFLLERYNESKLRYEQAQQNLADFEDSNINTVTNRVKSKRTRLEAEYRLHNQIFSELSRQLESSKMSLQKDTPVFTIVSPPVVSSEHISPITIISTIKTAVLVAFGFILFALGKKVRKDILLKMD